MRVIVYNDPVMKKHTYINNRASINQANEATITNLNLGVTLESNGIYKITPAGHRSNQYPMGYLYKYDGHLYGVMTYGATYTKQYCTDLKDGFMIGYDSELSIGNYEDANKDRKLFHEFLKRYMAGEFKYHRTNRSKPKYYHELDPQIQRNIKCLMDTLNDIYAA